MRRGVKSCKVEDREKFTRNLQGEQRHLQVEPAAAFTRTVVGHRHRTNLAICDHLCGCIAYRFDSADAPRRAYYDGMSAER